MRGWLPAGSTSITLPWVPKSVKQHKSFQSYVQQGVRFLKETEFCILRELEGTMYAILTHTTWCVMVLVLALFFLQPRLFCQLVQDCDLSNPHKWNKSISTSNHLSISIHFFTQHSYKILLHSLHSVILFLQTILNQCKSVLITSLVITRPTKWNHDDTIPCKILK